MPDTDLFATSDDSAKAFLAAPNVAHEAPKPKGDMDLLPTRQQYEKTIGDLTKVQEEKTKADSMVQSSFEQNDKRNRARMERLFAAQGATIDDLKPWNAQKELADRKTDLWEQFGSPGFIIAMLGSAFSAMPMNSALEAGGAAMNAINQGDMQAYNRAFDAWKENTRLTIDRQKMEHELYNEADKLRESDMAAWRAKVAAVAARFDDKRKLALLQNGMDGELITALGAEAQAAQKLSAARDGLVQQKLKMDMLNVDPDWKSGDPTRMKRAMDRVEAGQLSTEQDFMQRYDREHPDAKFEERLEAWKQLRSAEFPYRSAMGGAPTKEKEITTIKSELKIKHPDWDEQKLYAEAAKSVESAHRVPTANEKIKQEAHIGQYDLALTDILPQAESILRRHVGAAGVAGYATRTAESVSNVLGSSATDRRQFESDIEQLQLMGPRMLLDISTGRPLSTEHAAIDRIIRGLNIGDTTANTLRALDELKRRLTTLRGHAAERIGEKPEVPAAEGAAPAAGAGWDEYPEVK